MQLLLGSGGFRTPERIALLAEHMRDHFGPIERVLFIPYALADHDKYVNTLVERGLHAGYTLDGIHRHADPRAAVRQAEAIYVGGGNSFRLLDRLQRLGLVEEIRARVRGGVPYLGISAGSNLACPTIKTTNDMPIVQPASLEALGLVRFQINPHYFTGQFFVRQGDAYVEHFGETRDERIREFHEENETPVLGLWEGGILRICNDTIHLAGAGARLFRRGMEAVDFATGSSLTGSSLTIA